MKISGPVNELFSEVVINLNSTIDSVASLEGIKHIETLELTFEKATVDADKNEPKTISKTAYFNYNNS